MKQQMKQYMIVIRKAFLFCIYNNNYRKAFTAEGPNDSPINEKKTTLRTSRITEQMDMESPPNG